jgi:hypothetical protein
MGYTTIASSTPELPQGSLDPWVAVCYCHGPRSRPALHAETATRGSEPVASATSREKTRLGSAKISKGIEGFDPFEGGASVEALSQERDLGRNENFTGENSTGESGSQSEGAGQAENPH